MTLVLDKDNPLATKVQTRDGREARLLCVDADHVRTIVALVRTRGREAVETYHPNGLMCSTPNEDGSPYEQQVDLINAPEEVEITLVRRMDDIWFAIPRGETPIEGAFYETFARIKVRKGEGL